MIPVHSLHTGDVILVSGTGLISRCIQWCTDSEWSHAAIYVGGGAQHIIEAAMFGVRISTVDKLLPGHLKVCVKRLPKLSVDEAEKIKDYCYKKTLKTYDYRQLVTMGIYSLFAKVGIKWKTLVKNSTSSLICSELVANAFGEIGVSFGPVKMVSPATLYESDLLTTVLEIPL